MYLNTCIPVIIHALPILIHWVSFQLHILIHASPILIHWVGFQLNILPTLLGKQSESSVTRVEHPRLSATNQNRVLRNPSRQPIRIEHYVTRVVTWELSARPEDPSRLSARVGSLFPILIHEGLPHPCSLQLKLLLLTCYIFSCIYCQTKILREKKSKDESLEQIKKTKKGYCNW